MKGITKLTINRTSKNAKQCRRNEIHIGGGGSGLPIVYLLIKYTVIKEAYYSLAIIGSDGSDGPAK